MGLSLFGFGESLLIHSTIGVSPWTVLAEGLSLKLNWSVGFATFIVSVLVLSTWIFLKQKPGLGTLLNIIIIAGMIDVSLFLFDFSTNSYLLNILTGILGVLFVGLGSGIYLIANLGPGPRDGLMTGLQRITNFPIAWVRASIEISVVIFGWILGGTVGLGTLIFAFGIGPAVALGLYLTNKISLKLSKNDKSKNLTPKESVKEIVKHALKHNYQSVEKALIELYLSGVPLPSLMDDYIEPVLVSIQNNLDNNNISVAEEHIARKIVSKGLNQFKLSVINTKKYNGKNILGLNECAKDCHEAAVTGGWWHDSQEKKK